MEDGRFISIITRSEAGDPVRIDTKCRCFQKNDMYHILFCIDEDRCRISFDKNRVKYKRQGELSYDLRLIAGETTTNTMSTMYGTTSIRCTTISYELSDTKDAIYIVIKYNMAGETCTTKITIKERV